MAVDQIVPNLDGKGLQIGIVVSRFNEYAGRELYAACLEELKRLGVEEENITHVTVPGALEIPFALSKLAATGDYDALVALGAVIRGETYHFEIVSNQSAAGIERVSLSYDIPIANGVLTCNDDDQCKARTAIKGKDCAQVAVEMSNFAHEFPEVEDVDEDEEPNA